MTDNTLSMPHPVPDLTGPLEIIAADLYRDGGSTEIVVCNARQQQLILWFDTKGDNSNRGWLLSITDDHGGITPIAPDSDIQYEVVRLLRDCLEHNPAAQRPDLVQSCVDRVEELRKFARYGIRQR